MIVDFKYKLMVLIEQVVSLLLHDEQPPACTNEQISVHQNCDFQSFSDVNICLILHESIRQTPSSVCFSLPVTALMVITSQFLS